MNAPSRPVITVELTLDTIVGSQYETGEPVTLSEMVAIEVASQIVQSMTTEIRQTYMPDVRQQLTNVVDTLLADRFRSVLEEGFVPTDNYGALKGERTTLGEFIAKQAQAWLSATKGDGYGRGGTTNLGALINEAVGRSMKSELDAAVKEAKAAAVKVVADQAAEIMTAAMVKATGA